MAPRKFLLIAALLICPAVASAELPFEFGVSVSPPYYPFHSDSDLQTSLAQALLVGDYGAAFWEWGRGERSYQTLGDLTRLFHGVGMGVVAQLGPTSLDRVTPPPDLEATSFADPQLRQRYLADVERMAACQPEYMNIAAEINLFTYLNPEQYPHFRSLYNEAYDRAKAISPRTQVGVSYHADLFHLERNYAMPMDLGPQDFIGVSAYPSWLVYREVFESVESIPTGYYGWLRDLYPETPLVFTEVGWPHDGMGNLDDQAAFVRELPRLFGPLEPEVVVWTLLHDVQHFDPDMLTEAQRQLLMDEFDVDAEVLFDQLNSMGLRTWDGRAKPAWLAALSLRQGGPEPLPLGDWRFTPESSDLRPLPGRILVPEPGSLACVCAGGIWLLRRRPSR